MTELLLSLFLSGLISSVAAAYFLFIWFDGAKFFVEYLNLIKADRFIKHLKFFNQMKAQGAPYTYLEYIEENYNSFLVRLVTCPKCFSIWIATAFWILLSLIVLFLFPPAGKTFLLFTPIQSFFSAFLSYNLHKLTK